MLNVSREDLLIMGFLEPVVACFSKPLKASNIVSDIQQKSGRSFIYYHIEAGSPAIKDFVLKPH